MLFVLVKRYRKKKNKKFKTGLMTSFILLLNNRQSFHLWRMENLVKHRKIPKYYETDCLQNFLLRYMFLIITNFVKDNHIQARIWFIFLKNLLNQTWNAFNTKFQHLWKNWKSSYQLRESFAPPCNLFALNLD